MEEQKKVKKNKLINRVFYYTYLNHRTNCNYIIFIVTTLLHIGSGFVKGLVGVLWL